MQVKQNKVMRVVPHLTSTDPSTLWTGGMFLTERGGGSDVGANETVARKDADGKPHGGPVARLPSGRELTQAGPRRRWYTGVAYPTTSGTSIGPAMPGTHE